MSTLTKLTLPMPRLGETMDEGTIANWLVKPGDTFKRGDALLELETDKTTVEYPALGSGTLLETLVGPGDLVTVGAPIAVIETEDAWSGIESEGEEPVATPEPVTAKPEPMPATPDNSSPPPAAGRLRATPLARRIARTKGIELETIIGTGRRGRIEAHDVESAVIAPPAIVRSTGRSDATMNVFFVHGFAGAGSNWTAVRTGLKRHSIASWAPDMPGHGRNNTDVHDPGDLVEWLTAELDSQHAPVHLVGHSLGAWVSTQAASRSPDRVARLTLIAPAGCGHDINGRFIQGMANASAPGELAHLMRLLGPKAATLNSEALKVMADELGHGRLKGLGDAMARGDTQRLDSISALRDLADRIPVAAIFGGADTVVPKEHIFNMPAPVACHVARAGHMPHWDAPGLVERLILRSM